MRIGIAAIIVLGALALVPPAPAPAFVLTSDGWTGGRIPFHSAMRGGADAIAKAARTWNRSGARVRWRKVTRGQARVIIRSKRVPGALGYATYRTDGAGRVTRATIDIAPGLRDGDLLVAVLVHEMGHVMGLGHETRRCATMNASVLSACGSVEGAPWQRRCRFVQRDDLLGALRIYGGRARRLPPQFCDVVAAPDPPAAPAFRVDGAELVVTFAMPSARTEAVTVGRLPGACPAKPTVQQVQSAQVVNRPARAGEQVEVREPLLARGRYCFVAYVTGPLGRVSATGFAAYDSPGAPPVAAFFASDLGDLRVAFDNLAYGEPPIAAQRWDFGDGGTSAEFAPTHSYAAPGTYQVTLSVTDADGRTATAVQAVEVAPGYDAPF